MIVKVIITRTIDETKIKDLAPLIKRLRGLAIDQPGYISGETLKNVDKYGEYLTISIWHSLDEWKVFESKPERVELVNQLSALLKEDAEYKVYSY